MQSVKEMQMRTRLATSAAAIQETVKKFSCPEDLLREVVQNPMEYLSPGAIPYLMHAVGIQFN